MPTAYNTTTGDIVAFTTHPTQLQTEYARNADIGFLAAVHPVLTGYVSSGAFIPYTAEQLLARANRPRGSNEWSNATMSWVSTATLAEAKQMRIADMKAAALAADQANINVSGVNFKADTETRTELMQEALVAQMAINDGLAYTLDWERANGNDITLTAAQVKALVRAMNNRTAQIRTQFKARRAAINAATTIAEVAAIVW